jgi:hypothetical protein
LRRLGSVQALVPQKLRSHLMLLFGAFSLIRLNRCIIQARGLDEDLRRERKTRKRRFCYLPRSGMYASPILKLLKKPSNLKVAPFELRHLYVHVLEHARPSDFFFFLFLPTVQWLTWGRWSSNLEQSFPPSLLRGWLH